MSDVLNPSQPVTTGLSVHKPKKVAFETWGCQMNVADSERMIRILTDEGYELTAAAEDADLLVLNTCHIREKSKQKILSRLGRIRALKDKGQKLTVAVAGCVAQAEGAKLLKDSTAIDLLVGPGRIDDIGDLIREHNQTRTPTVGLGFDRERTFRQKFVGKSNPLLGKNEISRFVTIQQGCNNYCTFCIVPHTRGREVSRPKGEILQEIEALVAGGCKEITLLGQNVNSYGLDLVAEGDSEGPFVDLLHEVCAIDGLERLRFTTSNPHDFTLSLANAFASLPQLGRYMHLPVQSGSNHILDRMKRKVTREQYLERVQWLRAAVPDIALSTDLIVGFPGETEEDFEQTISLVREVQFHFVYSFIYSPRRKTPAARYIDQIPNEVAVARLAKLNLVQSEITRQLHAREIGAEREVLVTYPSPKEEGVFYGRTPQFCLTKIYSQDPIAGQIRKVRIIDANQTALRGELI